METWEEFIAKLDAYPKVEIGEVNGRMVKMFKWSGDDLEEAKDNTMNIINHYIRDKENVYVRMMPIISGSTVKARMLAY
ncbi:hypothetical protein [Paenibacillus sp. FSL L8-0494]|uniref:hypothetical protein n=1 Tax=Paenibacillus sp. FSL L8-0494 TaxID=2975352 RepID=UPI0030F852D0